jgi:hypothetical protein
VFEFKISSHEHHAFLHPQTANFLPSRAECVCGNSAFRRRAPDAAYAREEIFRAQGGRFRWDYQCVAARAS